MRCSTGLELPRYASDGICGKWAQLTAGRPQMFFVLLFTSKNFPLFWRQKQERLSVGRELLIKKRLFLEGFLLNQWKFVPVFKVTFSEAGGLGESPSKSPSSSFLPAYSSSKTDQVIWKMLQEFRSSLGCRLSRNLGRNNSLFAQNIRLKP